MYPDVCECDVGYEGITCEQCVKLPGCQFGKCTEALECICDEGYTGAKCDTRECMHMWVPRFHIDVAILLQPFAVKAVVSMATAVNLMNACEYKGKILPPKSGCFVLDSQPK